MLSSNKKQKQPRRVNSIKQIEALAIKAGALREQGAYSEALTLCEETLSACLRIKSSKELDAVSSNDSSTIKPALP